MQSMGYSDESSDPEWKEEIKTEKSIKQIPDSSLKRNLPMQKFCEKWLKIFDPWLARSANNPNKPFCRACQCTLDCNRCHLQRHERTSKHARNLKILIERGEEAARENYHIRQERSKYYHQRKKSSSLQESNLQASDTEMYSAEDSEFVDGEAEDETSFDFVQTDAASAENEQYDEDSNYKQENNIQLRSSSNHTNNSSLNRRSAAAAPTSKKDRMKLFMQIQKDKNDLMSTFKELIGSSNNIQLSPPKEKNHVDLFFESVSSSVKALTPKLIAEAKMRVSQLICELELRGLTESDSNIVTPNTIVVSPTTGNPYLLHQNEHENVEEDHQQQQHHHQRGIHAEHDYETLT